MRLNLQQTRTARTLVKVLTVAYFGYVGWAIFGYVFWENLRVSSLNSWTRTVQRPGFVLLHKEQSPTHFLALFQTPDGRLAVCHREIGMRFLASATGTRLEIQNADGQDAVDHDSPIEDLSRDSR